MQYVIHKVLLSNHYYALRHFFFKKNFCFFHCVIEFSSVDLVADNDMLT